MNWVRISVAIVDDPRVHEIADELGVRFAEAVGLLVGVIVKLPQHAPTGALGDVADSLLERWAGWEGRRLRFAVAFRAFFLTERGVWAAWEKHNGAAQREHQSNRDRAAARRQAERDARERQLNLMLAGAQEPNGAPASTPDGTPYPAADGAALRTNERTKSSSRAGARGTSYQRPAPAVPGFAPGHAPAVAVAPPWCAECGPGELHEVPGQKRPVRLHATSCSRYVAPATAPSPLEVPA